ncbi:MAG: hypothetical protein EAX95_06570 [Candidatus Thorarchaeota archaeon]|nr:hypothetical protein [Candidatus Thorarchaeota archaeon]
MSSLVYIPIEGERVVVQGGEFILSNYRYVQWDRGSRTCTSIPLHLIREYKLSARSAMFKVVNGIVNVLGNMPRREEMRGAIGLREFDNLQAGQKRQLCEMCGVPFIHPDYPYSRWATIGFHRPFSRHFYQNYAWIKGEDVFTYWPDSFILTNYRIYIRDAKKNKLFIFPLHLVHTFEARKNKLKIKATTGNFEISGKAPRQDHLLTMWQARAWDVLATDYLDWLVRTYSYINPRHPLSQYSYKDTAMFAGPVAKETTHEMEAMSDTTPAGQVFVKPVIKNRCVHCNAPMSWETIDWTGPDQYVCPSCGNPHRVDYVRM